MGELTKHGLSHALQLFANPQLGFAVQPEEWTCGAWVLCFLSVNVKWGKEKFDAIELNTEESPMVFKAQLFALTGVQPARQKVMVKGGTLKVQV